MLYIPGINIGYYYFYLRKTVPENLRIVAGETARRSWKDIFIDKGCKPENVFHVDGYFWFWTFEILGKRDNGQTTKNIKKTKTVLIKYSPLYY